MGTGEYLQIFVSTPAILTTMYFAFPKSRISSLSHLFPFVTPYNFPKSTDFQAGARSLRDQEARDDLLDCGQHDCHGRYHRCHRGARGLCAVSDRGVHEQDLNLPGHEEF